MVSRTSHFFACMLTALTITYGGLSGMQQSPAHLYDTQMVLNLPSNLPSYDTPTPNQQSKVSLYDTPVTPQSKSRVSHKNRKKNGILKKGKRVSPARKKIARKKTPSKREVRHYVSSLFYDALELHKNLVTWDTFKIATMVFPFFVSTRMIDERLQNCFYDKSCHKNIYYVPKECHTLAQWGISVPIVLLGSQAFFSTSTEMRDTSRAFLLGLPFVFWTKTLVKKMQFEANMRPWHEDFDCTQRSGGGFPSGHMAEATYTALLYGLRFGYRFAIPLGVLATFIGVTFVACNRHYISQIVAGAGLGAIYGVAAYKLANSKINEQMKLGFKINNGGPALSLSYDF